jgi:hypothetical protein
VVVDIGANIGMVRRASNTDFGFGLAMNKFALAITPEPQSLAPPPFQVACVTPTTSVYTVVWCTLFASDHAHRDR